MPPIRFFISKRHTFLTASISLNGEIINPYSYYAKKGLVYITIIFFTSRQFFFYSKCTKANTCLFCDVYLVLFNKYKFPRYTRRCAY